MKIIFLILIFFVSITSSTVFADAPGISLSRLTGPVYLVEDNHYVTTNSLVYIGPTSVTVIGATWTPQTAMLLAVQIKRVTNRPISDVIDTSPDPEWSGGNAYWKLIGAKVIAIECTADLLKRNWTETVGDARKIRPNYPRLPLVLPMVIYSGSFQLQNGNIRAFYLGPSHTPGDIFVYFPKEQILDAGSILKEQLGNMAKADLQEYPKTLQRLKALRLPIRTIISGHWSPIHGPELINQYLRLLELYEQNDTHNPPLQSRLASPARSCRHNIETSPLAGEGTH